MFFLYSTVVSHNCFTLTVTALAYSSLLLFFQVTLDDVKKIVADCPKQRFGLKEEDGQFFIKANQGHSFQVCGEGGKGLYFLYSLLL